MLVPAKAFFTKGVGVHKEKLTSFELALRDAGIAKYNLVRVSSIFPPNCEIIAKDDGLHLLRAGQIVFAVIAEAATNEPSRRVCSSIGLAIPKDRNHYGYISEHHTYGMAEQTAGDYAEDLAASMLATVLGIEFDPETAWDVRKAEWQLAGEIVTTTNHTIAAEGPEEGRWVTVISAAVFCG
ncbi:MAG: pyruvoyl-dependent arginine decarboxylase [Longimicrobiales bacterium]